MAVAKKGRERQARAEEDNKAAAPSRGRRPAKHVGSGVDATSELNYNAEQTDSKSTRSMVAPRRGKSAEQKTAEVEETEQFAEQQEQTASRRTSETEERAAGAVNKATGETGPAEAETVETVLEALRDKVLLISATPEMTQQYEAIAKSLGARVSQPQHNHRPSISRMDHTLTPLPCFHGCAGSQTVQQGGVARSVGRSDAAPLSSLCSMLLGTFALPLINVGSA